MIFLADIEGCGSCKREETLKKTKNNVEKKKQESNMIKLANKLAGFSHFSQGELEVVKSYVATAKCSKRESSKVQKTTDGYQKKFYYRKQDK